MTRTSLSNLYRRLTANAAPALDAEDLAGAAEGTLPPERREHVAAALASSSAHADAARLLGALRAESEALAADIACTVRRDTQHRRPHRVERRVGAGRRFGGGALRWATAMAACLVAVVGVWTLHHVDRGHDAMPTVRSVARSDVIFRALEDDHIFGVGMEAPDQTQASGRKGDNLFHDDFRG